MFSKKQPEPEKAEPKYKLEESGPYQLTDPNEDLDDEESKTEDLFKDDKLRARFVRKVYAMLTVQLIITTVLILPFLFFDDVQEFVYDYPRIIFIFMATMLVPYLVLVCCEGVRRSFPRNIILLSIMTFGMSGVCGCLTAKWDTSVVLYAILLTILVTVSITLLAVCCPIDFTKYYMWICAFALVAVILAAIATMFLVVAENYVVNIIIAGIFVVVFSLFLLFDTQAIMGGRRIALSPEEHILATVQLYVDIIEVFLNFLEMIGTCAENET